MAMEYHNAGHPENFAVCEMVHHKVIAPIEKKHTEGDVEKEDNGWISVAERLPERNGRYLTHCLIEGQSLICILYYCKVGGFNESTVTHWMLLPEPPKESEGLK